MSLVTPRHIIDFIVAVVDPKKNETVLDPACGTAGFLISSYKHIMKSNMKDRPGDQLTPEEKERLLKNFSGYDISPDMVRLSLVNLYLHGFSNPHILEYDTLTSEERWNETADVILANPPFMSPKGGIRPHKRFSIQAKRSEVLFVDYIAEHLNPNGRAGVIVPEGIIFQSGNAYKNLRKMLIENYLWAVVSLPAGVFNPYSGVKTSILFMDKGLAKKTDRILFVKVENDGYDLGAQRRAIDKNDLPKALEFIKTVKSALSNRDETDNTDFAHLVDKNKIAESGDWNLSGERYIKREHTTGAFETISLSECCEFNNGLWKGKKEPFIKVKIIRNTNFRKDGFIDWSNIAEHDVEESQFEKRSLEHGDIIIEKSGGGPTQPVGRVVLFNRHEKDFSYSNFTSRIRVNDSKLNSEFLWLFLRDFYNRGKTQVLQKQTSGIRNLDFNLYKQIKIPLPLLDIQKAIVEEIEGFQKIIDGARLVVENYKPTIKIDPEWEMLELGKLFNKVTDSINPQEHKGIIKYIGLENIESNIGTISGKLDSEISAIKSTKTKFQVGDILYGKLRPNLNKVYYAEFDGICSTDIYVLRGDESLIVPNFYLTYLKSRKFNEEVLKGLSGSQLPRVDWGYFSGLKIPFPSFSVQQQIVSKIKVEQEIVNSNKKLIEIYEQKIKDKIAEVWGK